MIVRVYGGMEVGNGEGRIGKRSAREKGGERERGGEGAAGVELRPAMVVYGRGEKKDEGDEGGAYW